MSMTAADTTADRADETAATSRQIEAAITYFRKVDAGDATVLELFTDDVQLYFPKFGRTRGKQALARFAATLGAEMARLEHDVATFRVVESGNLVVVEGTERGVTRGGTAWPDGVVSEGRFCNVFEFEGALISRVHIYVDPDFTSRDQRRAAELRGDLAAPSATATRRLRGTDATDPADAAAPDRIEPLDAPAGAPRDLAATVTPGPTRGEHGLSDARQVQQVLAKYVRAVDARDGAAMASLFVADGRVELFYNNAGRAEAIGELVGAGAIADAVTRMLGPHPARGWSHHVTTDHLIEVDGDAATVDAQFVRFTVVGAERPAAGWPGGAHGMQGTVTPDESGYYRAALRRVGGAWKIATQRVVQDMPWAAPGA